MGFPYQIDLSDHAAVQGRSTELDAFISSSRSVTTCMITPDGRTRFSLSREAAAVDLLERDPHRGTFLPSETEGAFGSADASSQFFSASILAPVTEDMQLFGAYARGRSSLSIGSHGPIGDWSSAATKSFGLGLLMDELAEAGDRLSIMVGQPMRVERASTDLSVPIGRTEDGQVLTETRRVDLVPAGREIALEATYQFALDDEGTSFAAGSFVRLNPDYDPNTDPDVGIGFRYRLTF